MTRIILGTRERVTVHGKSKVRTLVARIDTGAQRSSIDAKLANELKLGPVLKFKRVKTAHGTRKRPVVKGIVEIRGKKIIAWLTLADRKHMRHSLLVGRTTLRKGRFLVDPLKRLA